MKAVCVKQKDLENHQYEKKWTKSYEIIHEVYISLKFSFEFWGRRSILLDIKTSLVLFDSTL